MRPRRMFQGATNRLETNRPPKSCEGDPAPSLVPAAALAIVFGLLVAGMGKREEPLDRGSLGELVPEDAPERGGCEPNCGR
jgi:hypothetical protein